MDSKWEFKWIWPDKLDPLWEDDSEAESNDYFSKLMKEHEEWLDSLSPEELEAQHRVIVPSPQEQEDMELEGARKKAKDLLSRSRQLLVDQFMKSGQVQTVLDKIMGPKGEVEKRREQKAKAIRAWLAQQLGRDDLGKASPIENEIAKYYTDNRSTKLGSLSPMTQRFLNTVAYNELLIESALNSNNVKSRDVQGYAPWLAVDEPTRAEVDGRAKYYASQLLSNLARGKGAVISTHSGDAVEVPGASGPLPGTKGASVESMAFQLLLDKFRKNNVVGTSLDDALSLQESAEYNQAMRSFVTGVLKDQLARGGARVGDPTFRYAVASALSAGDNAAGQLLAIDPDTGDLSTRDEVEANKARKDAEKRAKEDAARSEQAQAFLNDQSKKREFSAQLKQSVMNAYQELENVLSSRDKSLMGLLPDYSEVVESSGIDKGNDPGVPLPEEWEGKYDYPIAVPYRGGMLVAVSDGDVPRFVHGDDDMYQEYLEPMLATFFRMIQNASSGLDQGDIAELLGVYKKIGDVSDSRMKKRKRRKAGKGMTHVGKIGAALTDDVFRFWG